MSLFGFDPETRLARLQAASAPPRVPTLNQSIALGVAGFGAVSLLVFLIWAVGGRALQSHLGEGGFYAVCAVAFIGLAGPALRRLVMGEVALGRFYALFATAFTAYAVAWCVAWFGLRGRAGEWLGSLAGTLAFNAVLVSAFSGKGAWWPAWVALFATHSTGYFLGGFFYEFCRSRAGAELLDGLLGRPGRIALAQLLWGLAYGVGFGAGLGFASYYCQETVRARLGSDRSRCDFAN
jgi:hypothetical protein